MANTGVIRRNSLEQLRLQIDDEQGERFPCDCGQDYMTENYLRHHQQTNCRNRQVNCSFCNQKFPSSDALKSHLMACGNKTEQCPNCRQFIRRSHFAYHYENNCAPIDKVETPPMRPRIPVNQRPSLNANKPIGRTDVPSDDSPIQLTRINGRIPVLPMTARTLPAIIECEYCHQKCAKHDWAIHAANCLQNPSNTNHTPRDQLAPTKSNGITHIPCDICDQQIDLPNWSRHGQECREREQQRIKQRAQEISREPVTESIPCQYCKKQILADRLTEHQANCQSPRVVTQYETIDHNKTREANRTPTYRPKSAERLLPTNDSPQNPSGGSNIRQSHDTLPRASNGIPRREQPRDHLYYNDNQPNPTNGIADDRLYPNRNPVRSHDLRRGHHEYEPINSSANDPRQKRKKASWLRRLCCGTNGVDD